MQNSKNGSDADAAQQAAEEPNYQRKSKKAVAPSPTSHQAPTASGLIQTSSQPLGLSAVFDGPVSRQLDAKRGAVMTIGKTRYICTKDVVYDFDRTHRLVCIPLRKECDQGKPKAKAFEVYATWNEARGEVDFLGEAHRVDAPATTLADCTDFVRLLQKGIKGATVSFSLQITPHSPASVSAQTSTKGSKRKAGKQGSRSASDGNSDEASDD